MNNRLHSFLKYLQYLVPNYVCSCQISDEFTGKVQWFCSRCLGDLLLSFGSVHSHVHLSQSCDERLCAEDSSLMEGKSDSDFRQN